MNLTLFGNLISVSMVGTAVWLGTQWRPSPQEDRLMMLAIALSFSGGVLTAISSQMTMTLQGEKSPSRAVVREDTGAV
tara:strand:+ start:533 stop:766 length:234 start_codon:yes stop_codon:yes gene_type:complete